MRTYATTRKEFAIYSKCQLNPLIDYEPVILAATTVKLDRRAINLAGSLSCGSFCRHKLCGPLRGSISGGSGFRWS